MYRDRASSEVGWWLNIGDVSESDELVLKRGTEIGWLAGRCVARRQLGELGVKI